MKAKLCEFHKEKSLYFTISFLKYIVFINECDHWCSPYSNKILIIKTQTFSFVHFLITCVASFIHPMFVQRFIWAIRAPIG